jgi:hypothetical protein
MTELLLWLGRLAGLLGLAAVGAALALRAAGVWHLGSVQIGTLLQGGIAALACGAWAYAASLAERPA